jgi:hypothetical protein
LGCGVLVLTLMNVRRAATAVEIKLSGVTEPKVSPKEAARA